VFLFIDVVVVLIYFWLCMAKSSYGLNILGTLLSIVGCIP
jgi:hypothetical protein